MKNFYTSDEQNLIQTYIKHISKEAKNGVNFGI